MIKLFQISNSKQHVDNITFHEKRVHEKNHAEDEEAAKKGQKQRKFTQTLLSSAKIPNIGQENATIVKSVIQPDIAQNCGLTFGKILAKELAASNNVDKLKLQPI